ncbi:MAG: DUF29 domain-containing protein [Gammaproteobacteria bacterium]
MPAAKLPALHDRDFYTWATETAQAIRGGSFTAVDWESVAEELEDMGRSEQRQLESRLDVLLAHLLKWRYIPEPTANKSWALTIEEQRRRTRRLLNQSPGLKQVLEEAFAEAYGDARLQAARDCAVDKNAFPEPCPWAFDQIMDDRFCPGQ